MGTRLNFTAAAQALGVSQSAISRHVIGLEALLGTPLFDRRPHGLMLTPAGAALLPSVSKSFDRMEQSLNEIGSEGVGERTLRIHLPPSFAQKLAVPLLQDLRREMPGIALDIASPGTVGAPPHDVDAAVVYAPPQGGTHVSSLLWMERMTPMCRPDIARDAGRDLAAFLARSELVHIKLARQPRYRQWEAFTRQAGLQVDVARGLAFDTACLAAQYALESDCVALLDAKLFARDLEGGLLVAPFDTVLQDGYGYFLNVHPEDLADPAIAAFRAWISLRFAEPDEPARARPVRASPSPAA